MRAADRLIAAAIDILTENPGEVLQHGIRTERAIQLARTSQTTFFRSYTKESFVDALRHGLVAAAATSPAAPSTPPTGSDDARAAIRAAAAADFPSDDAETLRRLLAAALARGDTADDEALRDAYRESDVHRLSALDQALGAAGATVRRPFTVAQVSTVLSALREGLLLRRLVDPQSVPDELYPEAALALAIAVLDLRNRHDHLDDVGATLDFVAPAPNPLADLPDNPRQAVIDSAAAVFAQKSYYLSSLDDISETSGVPLTMLKRLFPTKAHIVIAAVRPHFDVVAQGVADDVSLGTDHATVIRRHLVRCARLIVDQRPFMDAMIASVSHDTQGFPAGLVEIKQELHFPSLIEPVIADAQQSGVFWTGQPSTELAAILTNTLFIRCFGRRTHSPEDNASFVADLLLHGMTVRCHPNG